MHQNIRPSDWDEVNWAGIEKERAQLRMSKIIHLIPVSGLHLDVGTGNGDGTLLVQKKKTTIGVEYGWASLSIASRKCPSSVQADARFLPFKTSSFHSITCLDVLEHIPQPQCAIQEMARVLQKTGCLILQTPNKEIFKERLLGFLRKYKLKKAKQPYDCPIPLKMIRDMIRGNSLVIESEKSVRYWASNPLIRIISWSRLFICKKR